MSWIEPIIDRTSEDVKSLKLLMSEIIEVGWDNISQSKKDSWLTLSKGAINAQDLLRIEQNIDYIVQQLGILGISVSIDTSNPNWGLGMYITLSQFNKIRNNVNSIKSAWYSLPTSPILKFTNTVDFNDANDIEKNIFDLKYMLDLLGIQIKPICGKAICGNQLVL
jgi:hypothetical protein